MNNSWVFIPLLMIADSFSLILSSITAYELRTSSLFVVDQNIQNTDQYLLLLVIGLLLWHILLAWSGGYRNHSLLFRIDEMLLQFKTSILLLVLLTSFSFLYHSYDYSRLVLFFGWLFFVFFGALGRQIYHRLKECIFRSGFGRKRMVLFGEGSKRNLVEKRILENPSLGVDLLPIPNNESLETFIKREWVDEMFLFNEKIAYEDIWKFRENSRNPNLLINLVPAFGNLYLRNLMGGFFDGMIMVSLQSPGRSRITAFLKRSMDIFISFAFLVLLSPFVFLAAILIKLDSNGPVFFSQTRIGKLGIPFTIYKFRTMFQDSEPYSLTPVDRNDRRITRVGSFLRATGLDELPQLWNVFLGEMSLVGPRPEMPFIVEKYNELESKRLKVRPGITGLWQVYARTKLLPIHSHVEFDLFYIENFSLALDIMILLDTIPTMLMRTGI